MSAHEPLHLLLARLDRGPREENTLAARFAGDILADVLARGLASRDAQGRLAITEAGRRHLAQDGPLARLVGTTRARQGALRQGTLRLDALPDSALRKAVIEDAESPLAWLASRRDRDGRPLISEAQLAGGERLRLDFTRAAMTPRVTADWSAVTQSGKRGQPHDPAAMSDITLAARDRVRRALAHVGPELRGLLIDVCCHLKGLEQVERERQWPARTARIVLCLALDRLAAHYGLNGVAEGPDRAAARTWLAEDARFIVADSDETS
jgi:hypothetical protein